MYTSAGIKDVLNNLKESRKKMDFINSRNFLLQPSVREWTDIKIPSPFNLETIWFCMLVCRQNRMSKKKPFRICSEKHKLEHRLYRGGIFLYAKKRWTFSAVRHISRNDAYTCVTGRITFFLCLSHHNRKTYMTVIKIRLCNFHMHMHLWNLLHRRYGNKVAFWCSITLLWFWWLEARGKQIYRQHRGVCADDIFFYIHFFFDKKLINVPPFSLIISPWWCLTIKKIQIIHWPYKQMWSILQCCRTVDIRCSQRVRAIVWIRANYNVIVEPMDPVDKQKRYFRFFFLKSRQKKSFIDVLYDTIRFLGDFNSIYKNLIRSIIVPDVRWMASNSHRFFKISAAMSWSTKLNESKKYNNKV